MKKSTLKNDFKLKLNRETLRALEQSELADVAGGATASECLGSCYGCNTRNTCGTRYC